MWNTYFCLHFKFSKFRFSLISIQRLFWKQQKFPTVTEMGLAVNNFNYLFATEKNKCSMLQKIQSGNENAFSCSLYFACLPTCVFVLSISLFHWVTFSFFGCFLLSLYPTIFIYAAVETFQCRVVRLKDFQLYYEECNNQK